MQFLIISAAVKYRIIITKYEKLTKNEQAPLLFSLSGLIKAANSKYGYSAQEVLDICQALYETHRLTTYPRTDCESQPHEILTDQSTEQPRRTCASYTSHRLCWPR